MGVAASEVKCTLTLSPELIIHPVTSVDCHQLSIKIVHWLVVMADPRGVVLQQYGSEKVRWITHRWVMVMGHGCPKVMPGSVLCCYVDLLRSDE